MLLYHAKVDDSCPKALHPKPYPEVRTMCCVQAARDCAKCGSLGREPKKVAPSQPPVQKKACSVPECVVCYVKAISPHD